MKIHFAIPPWEHPGAQFDPAPHAEARLEIGGKSRRFWLKMREGVIYFREPSLVPLYAIPQKFEAELAGDVGKLVALWKREVEAGNYGSFFISHRKWKGTPVSANFCIILRANGSGWIKEHFDDGWRDFSVAFSCAHEIWCSKPTFSYLSGVICKKMRPQFLNRAVDASHFQTISPHWSHDTKEMLSVWRGAALLWLSTEELKNLPQKQMEWPCKSNSSFENGSVTGHITYGPSYRLNVIWDILKWHHVFVGVEWKRASEHPELQSQYNPQIWKEGFESWGENWRGNWIGRQCETVLSMLPLSIEPSQHEKVQAALGLREFLNDKMPADRLKMWLEDALKN